jgi:glycogen operon protein
LFTLSKGSPFPLGATLCTDGANFSIYCKNDADVRLLFFDTHNASAPSTTITLDARFHRTHYYWHVFVHGVQAGQLYGWQIDGDFIPEEAKRFDGNKVLLDPYARGIMYTDNYARAKACRPGTNYAESLKSMVVNLRDYDWEGDQPLNHPVGSTVMMELHVAGFTKHHSSNVAHPGTYLGLIEKIPYLKEMGVTTVELMPVFQYDWQEVPTNKNPLTGEPLSNFWGYCPIGYFAPHRGYCSKPADPMAPMNEFRDMVKALHRAGIEVILDVVYNHTAEGGPQGPTLSFRGISDRTYYIQDPHDPSRYADYTGTGNTFSASNSVVRRLIMDSLRYWVQEMHVDGFRFDLASALSRGMNGRPMQDPPILWEIETDPVLARSRIIAEPWDAAGLYQVGQFVGYRWAEENGKYRDDIRRFIKGDAGVAPAIADSILGSPNLYRRFDDSPHRSINYVTFHDGFTLNDLVSYNYKHNEANGENSRDGSNTNFSWNHGTEGASRDPLINQLREKQIKNFITLLLVSQGVPRLMAGDEFRRTQNGNNNAYCQDNELSWLDWNHLREHRALQQFVRQMMHFRLQHPELFPARFLAHNEVTWHGVYLRQPDWGNQSHTIAFTLHPENTNTHVHVIANAYDKPLQFELPLVAGKYWRRVVDTARNSNNEVLNVRTAPIERRICTVADRSVVVLEAVL